MGIGGHTLLVLLLQFCTLIYFREISHTFVYFTKNSSSSTQS